MMCPCHSNHIYAECCAPYHAGKLPETALQLMRSRYSAYALGNAEYIMGTTHPRSPHFRSDGQAWREAILEFAHSTRFEGLEIVASEEAYVTFIARLRQGEYDASFQERSHFEKVAGKWLYLDGYRRLM